MSYNRFGHCFSFATFGESHGPCMGATVDGVPPGMPLTEAMIQEALDRRRPGQSHFTTQRREPDTIKICSGVFDGKTTGTPIGLIIENQDQRSTDYSDLKDTFRPGHADFTYQQKYGIRDHRGGGRSSARETAMWVAVGAIAMQYLSQYGITIRGALVQMGDLHIPVRDWAVVNENPFFVGDLTQVDALSARITDLRRAGDSIGAKVLVVAEGVPAGLGEPVFGKLDADIAHAMMGINAAKAVEIGDGIDVAQQLGSAHRDEMDESGFLSNHAGGVLGGISTGMPIVAQVAFKPTSSIVTPGRSINRHGDTVEVMTKGRHDPCVGIRAVPIVEAMMACVIMDHLLRDRAQMGQTRPLAVRGLAELFE